MNEKVMPNYYAVIPSQVRYCKELKYPERLLYGEIKDIVMPIIVILQIYMMLFQAQYQDGSHI